MNLNLLREVQVQFASFGGVIIYCEQKTLDRKVSVKKVLVIYLVVYIHHTWTSADSGLGIFVAK